MGGGPGVEPVGVVSTKSGSMMAGEDGLAEDIGDGDLVVEYVRFA